MDDCTLHTPHLHQPRVDGREEGPFLISRPCALSLVDSASLGVAPLSAPLAAPLSPWANIIKPPTTQIDHFPPNSIPPSASHIIATIFFSNIVTQLDLEASRSFENQSRLPTLMPNSPLP